MVVSTVLLVIIGVTTTCATLQNVAQGKSAYMSSNYYKWPASKAVDGNTNNNMNGDSCFHTNTAATNWWYVDLGQNYQVSLIEVFNRKDCCADRSKNIAALVGTSLNNLEQVKYWADPLWDYESVVFHPLAKTVRYVKFVQTANTYFHLCEVKVYARV
ncbi:fucolectin-6-like [Mercenaria mercenaria]|uniref:fucolectin-6-like n=1 Tax=Mercenaria mercenaria TaxID=6596 RepID=UPI00234F5314|nr:fucolectin-6-like [Mercenaria mercenaria]XP_053407628.1 fucolectin-6-like [Mercenaria mercenaria]